ncbi:MAG: hypothetical protein H7834_13570 [Magnetococcus sp. YQC-9]
MTNSNSSDAIPSRAGPVETATPALEEAYLARNRSRFVEAVNRFNRSHDPGPAGIFAALFAHHWLNQEIHPSWRGAVLAVSRNPEHQWLATLLEGAQTPALLIERFLAHWRTQPATHPKAAALTAWLAAHPEDPEGVILKAWQALGLFHHPLKEGIRRIQLKQKEISQQMGGSEDRQRLALVDALPTPRTLPPWTKVGFIPRMACSQSCRHCQFVWREPLKQAPDSLPLLHWIDAQTQSLLFTGGELHDQLPLFAQTIRDLPHIRAFAILLNAATATTLEAANHLLRSLDQARRKRPKQAAPCTVILQISCDEYHQEILTTRNGSLYERIPIANIANLIQLSPSHPEIRLILLHKQTRLNLSNALLERGVIARLTTELLRRGIDLKPLRHALSPRTKQDPIDPSRQVSVIRDLLFALSTHPDHPIQLMSATIDAYGRAALLDPSEYIQEKGLLDRLLHHGDAQGESFDIDPMIRIDGVVSCFSADHLWMGNLYEEARDTIRARFAKDPLLAALARFDRRLIDFHREIACDTDGRIAQASGPHHLFHQLTEEADARLHLTKRLLASR